MSDTTFHRFLLVLTFTLLGTGELRAQTGAVVGRVLGDGQRPLAGVSVRIEDGGQQTLTGERGEFRFASVPAGTRVISAQSVGFAPATATVRVSAGETVNLTIRMEVSPFALDEIIVEGQVGQAEAYNRQRTAASIRNVVSAEQIERFPDAQVPDALRRIPGVSARPDRGETGYIFLRGLSPDLTTVTIDGARLPSTAQTGRGVELSSIPSEMLSSIEVIKAVTPDMDAEAVAGTINLSARRPTQTQFDGRFEGGTHQFTGNGTYRGGANFSTLSGPLAFTVGGDFAAQQRGTENLQYAWGNWEGSTVLNRLMLQQYPIDRSRWSLNSALHHTLGDDSQLFVRGFYSAYNTEEERHRVQFRLDNGQRISPTEAVNGRVIRQARQYKWERRIWNVTAGGDHRLPGGLRLDYHASAAQGRRAEPYRNYFEFRQNGVDMLADASASYRYPRFSVTNAKSTDDLSDFRMMYYEWRLDDNRDRDLSGGVNVTLPLNIVGAAGSSLRFGAKVYDKEKTRDMAEGTLDDIDGVFTMDGLGTLSLGRRNITPNRYAFGPILDWRAGQTFWAQNQNLFSGDLNEMAELAHTEDYIAGERVTAGYGMATFELGALQLIGGLRYEHTVNNYRGKRTNFDAEGNFESVDETTTSSSYGSLFPALHARLRVDDATNLRFAVTRTIARPEFLDLAPNEYIRRDIEIVRRGNPELRPAASLNVDLLAERYFGNVGVVSAGVFAKRIADFAFTRTTTIDSGPLAGFELRTPENGADATVYGGELALHRRLDFLPGALAGFGLYGNYTYTRSETDFGDAQGRTLRLPEQFDHIANAALTYDLRGFSGLLSLNYQSDFIDSVGSSDETDRWGLSRTQIDASLGQRLTPRLRAMLQLNNLTNEPYIRYIGSTTTPYETEFEGRWASLGFRFEF